MFLLKPEQCLYEPTTVELAGPVEPSDNSSPDRIPAQAAPKLRGAGTDTSDTPAPTALAPNVLGVPAAIVRLAGPVEPPDNSGPDRVPVKAAPKLRGAGTDTCDMPAPTALIPNILEVPAAIVFTIEPVAGGPAPAVIASAALEVIAAPGAKFGSESPEVVDVAAPEVAAATEKVPEILAVPSVAPDAQIAPARSAAALPPSDLAPGTDVTDSALGATAGPGSADKD